MFDRDLSRFASLMAGIGVVYNKSLNQAVIDIYWNLLRAFSLEEVEKAIKCHCENPDVGKYLPKPSDLIMAMEGSSQNQALRAWTKVYYAIQRVGSYASVAFDDPLIHAVIVDMDGWQKLCWIDDKQLPFIAKEFQERYRGYVVRRPTKYPKYFIGVFESRNSLCQYSYAPPRLIGDETKVKQVMATGSYGTALENKEQPFKIEIGVTVKNHEQIGAETKLIKWTK